MNESEISGYRVAYGRDETQFPVYVMAVAAIGLLIAFVYYGGFLLFLGFAATAAVAYYNYPLIETGRPRVGANQYGVFIDGFGVIQWRAIDKVELVPIAVRVMTFHELQIGLKQPLQRALVADWRKMPWPRLLMRVPWKMTHENVIRINLEVFDQEPDEIHRTIQRMWRHYRS
ncbi:MAG: hypothetical protein Q7T86_00745 [Hyphomicrobiaceae bacterium]|nr:hypothetical protein [Hyphomicrobiaceae bacterium]